MDEQPKKKNGSDIGGMVCAGCMFLGAGMGWFFKVHLVYGGAIGLGVGLIAMAGIIAYYRKK